MGQEFQPLAGGSQVLRSYLRRMVCRVLCVGSGYI